jgi:5-methylcytosine-specific restriction endonuclease McrA
VSKRHEVDRLRSSPSSPGSRSVTNLGQQVLRRDGWRCQACGAMSNLEVHHKRFRSHSGHDSEENLITPVHSLPRSEAPLSIPLLPTH